MAVEFPSATREERDREVVTVKNVPMINIRDGANAHIVPGKQMTLCFATFDAHKYLPVHSHPHEQMLIILKGEMDAIRDGKRYRLHAGEVLHVPGGVPHGAQTLDSPCEALEVFAPSREEFEAKHWEVMKRSGLLR
jgi:quercetin dioxygenase-like cupin family protein